MFPIGDDIPTKRFPWVNWLLIAISSLAFYAQLSAPDAGDRLVARYGMIPARLAAPPGTEIVLLERQAVQTPFGLRERTVPRTMPPAAYSDWATLITCIFLHGGWLHFLGNMWFLYIFGDNVEDRLGHGLYLLLYLGTGLVAGLAHAVSDLASPIPTIGASGAIAGVMGAYLLFFPHAKVLTVIPLLILFPVILMPAPIFLGLWFVFQFTQGIGNIGSMQSGGVAWWAHIGGFMAGVCVGWGVRNLGTRR
jgi:membrane associated rhomboid family serine protease